MNYTGFGQPQSFYTLSGGTIGGAGIWNPDMRSIRPEVQAASRAMGKKGVRVLPSGAGSRQELRYMREQAEQQGYDWTEAPTKYTRGWRELDRYGRTKDPTGFYDPRGRKFTGTQMWIGGGWRGRGEKEDPPVKLPEPIGIETTRPTQPRVSELGMSGEPIAFTPFGERVEKELAPKAASPASPFPAGTIGLLTGFGGIPRFPFGSY